MLVDVEVPDCHTNSKVVTHLREGEALCEAPPLEGSSSLNGSMPQDATMIICDKHGPAPVCLYSRDLLEMQSDGKLPDIMRVEVEGGTFEFLISPEAAAVYSITASPIPFDVEAAAIISSLKSICMGCFAEQRKALVAQQ